MTEWYGYRGKILNVDLSSGKVEVEEPCRKDVESFLGGAGMNAWLLYRYYEPGRSPLDPRSPLIFGAGPLAGTDFPSSGRSTFTAHSPLTGLFGDANAGGFFATMVRQAGYDHIVVRGASETPCYLFIDRTGKCTIERADEVWGLETMAADKALTSKHPGSMAAVIGPAGEKMVRYANILTHEGGNSWSRTGLGAVMGSKKLKAIVANGRGKIPVFDAPGFTKFCEELKKFSDTSMRVKTFSNWGTMMQISIFTALGLLFRENCRSRATLADAGKIGFDAFSRSTGFTSRGCYRCSIKCEKKYKVKEGRFAGEEGAKYELGYGCTLGFNLGIDDLSAILHLTNRCNALGIDVIDFSSSVATAIDLYRNNIITKSDTDGLELAWNDPATAELLASKIAMRQGFGDLLAEGVKTMAEKMGKGAEKYALHIKGMSEPAHSCPPFLLAFSVSTRGGDHLKGMPILILESSNKEMARLFFKGTKKSLDLFSHDDKGRVIWWHENYKTVIDSLGICFFLTTVLLASGRIEPAELATAYRLATGIECDGAELFLKGERAYQVERAFNALHGVTRTDDTFKVREEKDSWGKGINLDHPGMLDEYYQYRGCSVDGLPLRERLEEINLPEVAGTLHAAGKLGEKPCCGSYLSLKPLTDPMAQEFQVTPGKGDELVSKLMKDEKVMELIASPTVLNLAGWGINAKKKASDFFRSKHGVPTLLSAGLLGIYAYYLSRKNKKPD